MRNTAQVQIRDETHNIVLMFSGVTLSVSIKCPQAPRLAPTCLLHTTNQDCGSVQSKSTSSQKNCDPNTPRKFVLFFGWHSISMQTVELNNMNKIPIIGPIITNYISLYRKKKKKSNPFRITQYIALACLVQSYREMALAQLNVTTFL